MARFTVGYIDDLEVTRDVILPNYRPKVIVERNSPESGHFKFNQVSVLDSNTEQHSGVNLDHMYASIAQGDSEVKTTSTSLSGQDTDSEQTQTSLQLVPNETAESVVTLSSEQPESELELDKGNYVVQVKEIEPYKCTACHQRFRTYAAVRVHMILHIEVTCWNCGRESMASSDIQAQQNHLCLDCVRKTGEYHDISRLDIENSGGDEHAKGTEPPTSSIFKSETPTIDPQQDVESPSFIEITPTSVKSESKASNTGKIRAFMCKICGTYFKRKADFNVHYRQHVLPKTFLCPECGRTFSKAGNLNAHMAIHKAEKPHKCDICFRAFLRARDVNVHKRIHTGDKPYKCDTCNKAFTRSSNLREHQRSHAGIKRYQCDVCGKCFSRGNVRDKHMALHK